jgi:hypothetical protein
MSLRRRQRWVVIPHWERFQHYGDRRPVWVKNYTEQLDNEDYLELSVTARGLLNDLRLLYAKRKKQVPNSPSLLSHLLGYKVTSRDINRLCKAGFLEISASKPASESASESARDSTRSLEVDKDKEPLTPRSGELEKLNGLTPRELGLNPRALGTNPRAVAKRTLPRRQAERWLRNVGAREVPADRMAQVLREEWPELKAEELHELEALASELRVGEDIKF